MNRYVDNYNCVQNAVSLQHFSCQFRSGHGRRSQQMSWDPVSGSLLYKPRVWWERRFCKIWDLLCVAKAVSKLSPNSALPVFSATFHTYPVPHFPCDFWVRLVRDFNSLRLNEAAHHFSVRVAITLAQSGFFFVSLLSVKPLKCCLCFQSLNCSFPPHCLFNNINYC